MLYWLGCKVLKYGGFEDVTLEIQANYDAIKAAELDLKESLADADTQADSVEKCRSQCRTPAKEASCLDISAGALGGLQTAGAMGYVHCVDSSRKQNSLEPPYPQMAASVQSTKAFRVQMHTPALFFFWFQSGLRASASHWSRARSPAGWERHSCKLCACCAVRWRPEHLRSCGCFEFLREALGPSASCWINSGYIGCPSNRLAIPRRWHFDKGRAEEVGHRDWLDKAIAPGIQPRLGLGTWCLKL